MANTDFEVARPIMWNPLHSNGAFDDVTLLQVQPLLQVEDGLSVSRFRHKWRSIQDIFSWS